MKAKKPLTMTVAIVITMAAIMMAEMTTKPLKLQQRKLRLPHKQPQTT
jgi:hypothetical protein